MTKNWLTIEFKEFGVAELIASESDVIEEIAPWLTLDGLQMIYTRNNP